jgi:hypothetical protein
MYADIDIVLRNGRAVPARWQVLRSRSFLVRLAAQAASLLGDFFNYVAVAWLVLELTAPVSLWAASWRRPRCPAQF